MPTSSMGKFNSFVEYLAEKAIDLQNDTFKVVFCAAANAPTSSNTVLANLTTATTNADSVTLTVSSSSQTSGTYTLLFADKTITATAGGIGPFRYVVVYDDTPTSPADPLVCYYDYGSDITVASGETFTLNWTTSTFTIGP